MEKREIKFRAKDCETGDWLYGSLIQRIGYFPSILYPVPTEDGKIRYIETCVDKETIGQYTGLKDKNGKEIYEGDIMEVTALDFIDKAKNKKNFVVKYENGFICHIINEPNCWMHLKTAYEKVCYSLKVIGNIFDNSDLIKEAK